MVIVTFFKPTHYHKLLSSKLFYVLALFKHFISSTRLKTALSLSEVPVYRKLLFAFLLSVSGLASALPTGPIYTVTKGDTAYSLAKRYGLNVDQLLSLNHLSSPALEVGQLLLVTPPTYTVVKGDTAYSVARRSGLSVDALLSFNGMSDPHLEIGQLLRLTPNSAAPQMSALATPPVPVIKVTAAAPSVPQDAAPTVMAQQASAQAAQAQAAPTQAVSMPVSTQDWVSNAQSLLGVPYVWGAQNRSGTDCSGFVLQVFTPLGLNLPRTSAAQAQIGQPIGRQQIQPGDLVFFDTEGRGRVTHVGISLGGNEFINANSYAGRVAIDDLNSRYWASRFLSARRVLTMANAAAVH